MMIIGKALKSSLQQNWNLQSEIWNKMQMCYTDMYLLVVFEKNLKDRLPNLNA